MNFLELRALVNESGLNVVAVDIGENGGVAANYHADNFFCLIEMQATPGTRWLSISDWRPTNMLAENVHAMPGQGISSTGTLMRNKGQIEGFAAALGLSVDWVEPLRWIECFTLKRTKHFDTTTKWKRHLVEIAQGIAEGQPFVNEINYKTADAFLMWVYAAHKYLKHPMKPKSLFQ